MLKMFSVLIGLLCLVMANAQLPAVLDTTGQAVQPFVQYYILPSTASGGGVTLVNRNGSCPLYVGQEARAGANGLPVYFNPFVTDQRVVRESFDLAISFSRSPSCNEAADWVLDNGSGERVLIRTAQENTPSDFFRIERNGNAYKLNYCPTDVCPTCRVRCGDIGVSVENGRRLLALYVPALSVVFRRA